MNDINGMELIDIPLELLKVDDRVAGEGNDIVSASIDTIGVIMPVVVQRIPDSIHYKLIKGRVRVANLFEKGEKSVPALVLPLTIDALTIEAVLTLVRKKISPIYEARLYDEILAQPYMTQGKLAYKLGLGEHGRVTINNSLRLLRLPEETIALIDSRKLKAAHGFLLESALTKLGPNKINDLAHLAVSGKCTSSALSIMIQNASQLPVVVPLVKPPKEAAIVQSENQIGRFLNASANIKPLASGAVKVTLDLPNAESLKKFFDLFPGDEPVSADNSDLQFKAQS